MELQWLCASVCEEEQGTNAAGCACIEACSTRRWERVRFIGTGRFVLEKVPLNVGLSEASDHGAILPYFHASMRRHCRMGLALPEPVARSRLSRGNHH